MGDSLAIPLSGNLVSLEPLTAADEEPLWRALDHDEVWTWINLGRVDRERFSQLFGYLAAENAAGRYATWVVRSKSSGDVVGTSGYLAIRLDDLGVEIGNTLYAPYAWRTGYSVETKLLMLGYGFETLGLKRIELKTDARNERSRAAMEALPAQFEGIFRKHMVVPGGMRDSAYYSVIDDEWPEVKANLERRLASRVE